MAGGTIQATIPPGGHFENKCTSGPIDSLKMYLDKSENINTTYTDDSSVKHVYEGIYENICTTFNTICSPCLALASLSI